MGAQRFQFAQNFPKIEDYQSKTAQNQPKLRESCAPWQKLKHESCTKVALRNIAIFWWD